MKDNSISKTFFNNSLVLILLASGIGFATHYYFDLKEYLDNSNNIEKIATESQKNMIKNEVEKAFDHILYKKSQLEQRVHDNIAGRVHEAHAIATHLYQINKGKKTLPEIEEIIKEALRPHRFFHDRGYFFAFSLDGIERLFADRPEIEGKNILHWQDTNGKYVIRDMIEIATRDGEGFYQYTWTKPDSEGKGYAKLSYVKYFEPLGWIIGSGDYIDEVEQEIQQEVLERIAKIRFGRDGYIFVVDYQGTTLMNDTQRHLIGKNIWDLEDPNGVKVIQEERRAVETPGGDFIYYVWNKPSESKPSSKVSFVKGFPEWQWMIGAGVYLEDIDTLLLAQQQKLKNKLIVQSMFISAIIVAAILVLVVLAKRLAANIAKGLNLFNDFFQSAASEDVKIDVDKLKYDEHRKIAATANRMVEARVRIEKKLQKAVNIIDNSPAVAFRWKNASGWPVEYVSKNVATIFDYAAESFTSGEVLYADLIHPDDVKRVFREISELSSKKEKDVFVHEPYRVIAADGSVKWLEDKTTTIRDKRGKITHYEGIIQDITSQVETQKIAAAMEERLQQAQKMEAIGTLAGGIAHDFNNILATIMGYAELIKEDAPSGSQLEDDIDNVLIAAHRAKNLVKQILSFSRQAQVERIPVNIQPLVKEGLKMLRSSIPTTISIAEDIQPINRSILADPTQVHQILINLCTNAYHAMEETGGALSVSLRNVNIISDEQRRYLNVEAGEYLELTVADTGPGIPPDVIDRIFDPYFTTKEVGKGTGMGLSIIHGIVVDYGGAITVDSRPGEGTTFHVYLPIVDEAALPEVREREEIPKGTERILFIDDEELLAKMGKDVLERLGYRVTVKRNSAEALTAFQNTPDNFDIVITDQTMPGMTGLDIARRMLQIRPDIPIILCTGYSNLVDEASAKAAGIKEFALKPLTRSSISRLIRQALGDIAR